MTGFNNITNWAMHMDSILVETKETVRAGIYKHGKWYEVYAEEVLEGLEKVRHELCSIPYREPISPAPELSEEPVGEQWCVYEEGEQRTSWYYVGQREGDAPGWEKMVAALPETLQIKKRRLYAGPIFDAEEPVAPTSSPLYSQEMFTAMKRERERE